MRAALAALNPPNPRHPFPPRDPSRPKGLNILGSLAHHPDLATAYHTFNGHLLFGTTLSTRQRELVILRVAAVRDAPYEWAQHVVMAGDVGLSDDEVTAIVEDPGASSWDDLERAMLAAVDELIADSSIGDDTWAVLADGLDTEQIMDVIFTVGAYDVLAMLMKAFRVPLDDDLLGIRPLR
jgi:alkylhydroperoxidase family enzyme